MAMAVAVAVAMARTRIRRIIASVILVLCFTLFVGFCVPRSIHDLRLVSLVRSPASVMPAAESLRDILTRRHEPVWAMSFAGDARWIGEIRRHRLNTYAIVLRCDDRDRGLFSLGPFVDGVRITVYDDTFARLTSAPGTRHYTLYVPERGNYRSEADINAPMPAYDLARARVTLCIRIAGGAMTGAYSRSNEVRVTIGPPR